MGLQDVVALQVLHQHAGLGQWTVGAKDPCHQGACRLQQHGCVIARQVQLRAGGLAVKPRSERAGAGVDGERCCPLPLPAQFLGGAHHIGGDGLVQLLLAGDGATEAAAHAGFLLRCWCQLQRQAGVAPQLPLQPQTHHAAFGAQFTARHVPEVSCVADAPQATPMGQLSTDSPDILDRNGFQPAIGVVALAEVEHPGMVWGLFGQAIGQLGLGLAGP